MAKRSHGDGHISQAKNGKWRGQLMVGYHENGKRRIVSFTADTKREVAQKMREYMLVLHDPAPKDKTFGEWANEWYADYKTQVEASTYSGYRYTLNILIARFGKYNLSEMTPMDMNRFFTDLLEEGCSYSKIHKCRTMLIQIFDSAEANELVPRNPARRAKIIKEDAVTAAKQVKDSFTDEEIETLLRELPDTPDGNGVRLLLGTGLRVQELLALTAKDIAEDGSQVTVTKAVKTVDGKPVLGKTKSRKGVRTIPVPERFRPYAVKLRESAGKLFCIRTVQIGEPCGVGNFRKRYYSMLGKLDGVRPLSPHCCRHTYITRLQAKGVPMETIARLAGHSDIGTTDGYLHVSGSALSDAVSVLNDTN